MCWSPNVTLGFVIFELCCCALLYARGERSFLVGMAPLVLQEIVQWLLWREIVEDERGGGGCSAMNSRLTALELVIVGALVPLGFSGLVTSSHPRWKRAIGEAVRRQASGENAAETDPMVEADDEAAGARADSMSDSSALLARLAVVERGLEDDLAAARLVARLTVAFILSLCAYTYWAVQGGWWVPFCTTRGTKGGHQRWPFVVPPLPPVLEAALARFDKAPLLPAPLQPLAHSILGTTLTWSVLIHAAIYGALAFTYFALLLTVALYKGEIAPIGKGSYLDGGFRRGRLPQLAIMFFGHTFILVSAVLWGAEFGSVWCWGASAAVSLMLVEPVILPWIDGLHDASRADDVGARDSHSPLVAWACHSVSEVSNREFVGASVWVARTWQPPRPGEPLSVCNSS